MDTESKLYFEDNKYKNWLKIPSWGEFFVEFGKKLAQVNQEGERLIVGIAVPTRAYAAALISLGVVLERSNSSKITLQEHFKSLCELPEGTPITFQEESKIYKGHFLRYEKNHGQDGIWIALERRSMRWIPFKWAINIEKLSVENPVELNKIALLPDKQSGKRIKFAYDFVTGLIGQKNLQTFFKKTRFDCAILGRANILREELIHTPFSILSEEKFNRGTLQDILRVRKFMGQEEHYHTNVFRMDSSKPPRRPTNDPYITIFDGAIGFLKWRDLWKNSHCVAIFDRTEPSFDNAITTFNQEYIKNRIDTSSIEINSLPPNCEIMAYKEVC